jgi:hypothetical protein
MTEKDNDEIDSDAQANTKKQPPIAGTVAGRVPVPAISSNEDPASPGADADRRQSED